MGAGPDLARTSELLRADAGTGDLTPREIEILQLVARGMSDAQIAERLVVSPHTVHRHVANIRVKLRLSSRSAAVAYAARAGLIRAPPEPAIGIPWPGKGMRRRRPSDTVAA